MGDTYAFDLDHKDERVRLTSIERLWDSTTCGQLDAAGVDAGWKCLEIGAGGGSIARWLARRVGGQGAVTAVDLDTRLLRDLPAQVTVHEGDVRNIELSPGLFDLVHARLVLSHLPDRAEVLRELAAACAPGGVLVIEDFDFSNPFGTTTDRFRGNPPHLVETFNSAWPAMQGVMAGAGFAADYGAHIARQMRAAGLDVVSEMNLVQPYHGDGLAFFRHSWAELGAVAVRRGWITADAVERGLRAMDTPGMTVASPVYVSVIGRVPAPTEESASAAGRRRADQAVHHGR